MTTKTTREKGKWAMFTLAELNQLEFYCETVEEDGWYYVPEEHFRNRPKSIVKKLSILKEETK